MHARIRILTTIDLSDHQNLTEEQFLEILTDFWNIGASVVEAKVRRSFCDSIASQPLDIYLHLASPFGDVKLDVVAG